MSHSPFAGFPILDFITGGLYPGCIAGQTTKMVRELYILALMIAVFGVIVGAITNWLFLSS
jgi:hypothetical protein